MADSCCTLARPPAALPPRTHHQHLPFPSTALLCPPLPPPCHLKIGNGGRRGRGVVSGGGLGARTVRATASPSFGSRMEENVKRTVSQNPVVVYSKTWCSYSMEVKSLFKRIGVEPLVIELDELGPQGPQLQKVLERITGQFTVPNVFIGGKHIGGCTDTVRLHRKGELTSLLAEAKGGGAESLQQP